MEQTYEQIKEKLQKGNSIIPGSSFGSIEEHNDRDFDEITIETTKQKFADFINETYIIPNIPYPPGHNWEGLTPLQVEEGYKNYEKPSLVKCENPDCNKEFETTQKKTKGSNQYFFCSDDCMLKIANK